MPAAPWTPAAYAGGKWASDVGHAAGFLAEGGAAWWLYSSAAPAGSLDVEVCLSLQILEEGESLDDAGAAALGELADLDQIPAGPSADAAAPVFARLGSQPNADGSAGTFPWQAVAVLAVAACEVARRQVTRSLEESHVGQGLAGPAAVGLPGPRLGELS
jgi:hypothetical protein